MICAAAALRRGLPEGERKIVPVKMDLRAGRVSDLE